MKGEIQVTAREITILEWAGLFILAMIAGLVIGIGLAWSYIYIAKALPWVVVSEFGFFLLWRIGVQGVSIRALKRQLKAANTEEIRLRDARPQPTAADGSRD